MDIRTEIPSSFNNVKSALIERFPTQEVRGLNTTRVEEYIKKNNLKVKPYVIFEKKDLIELKKIIGETKLDRSVFDQDKYGLYIPEIDLVLLMRDPELEEINGPLFTEGLLVHELVHATGSFGNVVITDSNSAYTPRSGFFLTQNKKPWGWFLEEGFADMLRGEYVSQHATDQDLKRMEQSLSYPSLSFKSTIPLKSSSNPSILSPIPIKYLFCKPESVMGLISSIAASGVEMLCNANPQLRQRMIEARNSINGLRALTQEIDKIAPGLYPHIQKTDPTMEDSHKCLKYIIEKLHGDIQSSIVAEGKLKETWDLLIREIALNDVNISVDTVEPEKSSYRTVTAIYDPDNTTIFVSQNNPEKIIADDVVEYIKQKFAEAGKADKFDDFLMVAIAAEEFAHFVDHTKGLLPKVTSSPKPAIDNSLRIQTYGVEINEQKRKLIEEVMREVFRIMDYQGNPPQNFIITNGELRLKKEGETAERAKYMETATDGSGKHYTDYDFEQRAKEVQSQVLKWWFRQKEGMNFDLILE